MTFRARQRWGWAVLLTAALVGGLWLASLDYRAKISSDVLDLVPSDDNSPELRLVRSLASEAEAGTMLIILASKSGRPLPADLARRFAARLAAEPAFAQAVALDHTAPRDALGAELFAHRFPLVFPRWLAVKEDEFRASGGSPGAFPGWLARMVAGDLERFIETPEAIAFGELIPADPLLLLPLTVKQLQPGFGLVEPGQAAPDKTRIWARLADSPLSEEGQAPAFAALERVAESFRTEVSDLQHRFTGVNRFAAESRARIEREVKRLNLLSLIAVLAVALTFVRSVYRGLHLLPVVLLSLLGAWVGTTLVFDRMHILVLVVGSLLTGVAIDYGFYLFMQPPARPDETYPEKVRRLAKPLLSSCLTTIAGFSLLLFSDLPFIRQLGVYVGLGLLCALVTALVYFATVREPYLETRMFRGGRALPPRWRVGMRRVLFVVWLAALPGLAMLAWKDDIRDLDASSAELKADDADIRAAFGDGSDRSVYLSYGDTLTSAREALSGFEHWLESEGPPGVVAVNLGVLIPTEDERSRAETFVRQHPEFKEQLRSAFATAGYDPAEFGPFFGAYPDSSEAMSPASLELAIRAIEARLSGPMGLLLHRGEPYDWFVTLVGADALPDPPLELRTVATSQLESLNRVFGRYRESALRLSVTGLAIVGVGVFLTYGLRDGLRIFAIPCGACAGIFGVLGWLGLPLNLFHLLGAFLGVCMTHNYAIFSATSAYRHEPIPVSVRVSALTTAVSFGVLATSGIPVVSSLGLTVSLMVLTALVAIELEHLSVLGGRA